MACSHTTGCDLYVQFAADPSIQVWKSHYCDSDSNSKRCARFQLSLQGKVVPMSLLPNGRQIEAALSDEERGLHALFNAIQKNRLPMVKAFLKTKVTTGKVVNSEGITPVMYAASLGRIEIMKFFLDHGCNPHHRSRKGETALEFAAKSGHDECVELLRTYMSKVAPPTEELAVVTPMYEETQESKRSALMARIMGFLRGNKPEAA